jgi:CMP-N-acetylneuraminic acid synthetase
MLVDALIPARAGSRRLPGKHLLPLGGRPLLDWTLQAAREAGVFRRITLSTDDPALHERGLKLGLNPFPLRPARLATDESRSADVLRHYLEWLPSAGLELPDWVMLLQPTSPFRGAERIREACELAGERGGDVVSLGPVGKPLEWCRELRDGRARIWDCPDPAPTWRLNGAIYLARVERFLADGCLLPAEPLALLMEEWESVDIDTPLDWLQAQGVASGRNPAPETA